MANCHVLLVHFVTISARLACDKIALEETKVM